MASESDSEEFFDAQDKPVNVLKPKIPSLRIETPKETHFNEPKPWEVIKSPCPTLEEIREAERKAKENEKRRKKVEELRRKMLTDENDDENETLSQASSKTSSVDGIYMGVLDSKLTYRREVTEESKSSNSMISLGKVGNLLGDVNSDTLSLDSRDSMLSTGTIGSKFSLAEPDLVASTKGDRNISSDGPQPPIAPPRRKRKVANKQHSLEYTRPLLDPTPLTQGLPSPTTTVESIAHDLEYSLDLKSATRGQYVVKPQDHEKDRAPIATKETPLNHEPIEPKLEVRIPTPKGSLGAHSSKSSSRRNSGGANEDLFGQANFMMRTRSDSGRPLTDLEILEQVTVLNLDTGETIPLSLAEDRLPQGINPLSLHLMRLTSEYVSNSSLDKEKESDEESVAESHKSSMSDTVTVLKKT